MNQVTLDHFSLSVNPKPAVRNSAVAVSSMEDSAKQKGLESQMTFDKILFTESAMSKEQHYITFDLKNTTSGGKVHESKPSRNESDINHSPILETDQEDHTREGHAESTGSYLP